MTVEDSRSALKELPGDLQSCVSFPDFQNKGAAYETRDVRLGGKQDVGAGEARPCFFMEAWGGI